MSTTTTGSSSSDSIASPNDATSTASTLTTQPFQEPIASQYGVIVSGNDSVSVYNIPYTAALAVAQPSGAVLTGYRNATLPVVSNLSFVVTVSAEQPAGFLITGIETFTWTVPPSSAIPNNTSTASTSSATSKPTNSKSSGVSAGAAAGIAIATAIFGALLAVILLMIVYKKKERRRRSKHIRTSAGTVSTAPGYNNNNGEKPGFLASTTGVDNDRLLPQPLDDAEVKQNVQNLFTQIDGHVESFYSAASPVRSGVEDTNSIILEPTTRLFGLKQLICRTILESLDQRCPTDRSFLPYGYTSLTRQLQKPRLDDQLNTLLWSRLRMSVGLLLQDDSSTERTTLQQAIELVLQKLNAEVQPFEVAGQEEQRIRDLVAVLQKGAESGRMLMGQPALWSFDWTTPRQHGPNNHARISLVYFPALYRLTDNKANRLASPILVVEAKVTR